MDTPTVKKNAAPTSTLATSTTDAFPDSRNARSVAAHTTRPVTSAGTNGRFIPTMMSTRYMTR
jgi:hypothetical protein